MDIVSRSAGGFELPTIRRISTERPWLWLAAGWRDLWVHPAISLSYGLAVVAASYALTAVLLYFDVIYLLLPLAAGMMFAGPMLAVGLYEISRRIETGEPISIRRVVFVTTHSPEHIGSMALILALFMLIWVRIATLLFAVFFGLGAPPLDQVMQTLLFTSGGLLFTVVGGTIGGILALLAFAISAISIPRLMVRQTDVVTAIATSILAVTRNLAPMLLWAWLIALLTVVGMATCYIGLIVIFPLIGHATWHAYRDLVDEPV